MGSGYDENLTENLFFKRLRTEYVNLYRKAIDENCLICVPCSQSLDNYQFDERDMLTHILIPTDELPETHFLNLNDNLVTLFDNSVRCQDGRPVPILFVEVFYSEESRYRVLCLERPLNFDNATAKKLFNPRIYAVKSLNECVNLLHLESSNESVVAKIKDVINQFLFLSRRDFFCNSVKQQTQFARTIYERSLQIVLRDEKIASKVTVSRTFADNVRVAVESYVLHDIHSIVMKGLVSALTPEIGAFNKALRTLSHVQLQDITIKPSSLEGVMKARASLAFIKKCTTVLGKLNCLKQTINLLSMEHNAAKPSVDELLPVLVFLVAKSGITTWIAQLQYVKDFNFSQADLNQTNEYNFLVTTLEAVLTFIRSGLFFQSVPCSRQDGHPLLNKKTCRKSQLFWETKNKNLSRLFQLIYDDDMDGVRRTFEGEINKKPLVVTDPRYCHPLCSCDNCEKLRTDYGEPQTAPFTINSANGNGCTALHVAACYGRSSILDWLLGAGADPNCVDFAGSTPLHCAASHGHQNIVLLLACANATFDRRDDDGNTPLHLACVNGHLDCAKALLYFAEHAGIQLDVNSTNNDYDTSLHLATRYYYEDIVRLLLNYNGNPSIKNKHGNNAFELTESLSVRAALNDQSTIAINLMNGSSENFIRSDENGLLKKFKMRDISNDKFGVPPQDADTIENADKLFKAIRVYDTNMVKQLLGFGNSKSLLTRRSSNANNMFQSYKCHPLCQCEECLKKKNIQENASSDDDEENADFYKIDALSVNICDLEGSTPLHLACKYGHLDIVQFLLDIGARANARTYRLLSTPLHVAASSGQFSTVKLLLECGQTVCELDARDRNGNTALHLACAAGNSRMVDLLLQYDPNTELRNNYGKTPINKGEEILSYVIMQMLQRPKYLLQEELLG